MRRTRSLIQKEIRQLIETHVTRHEGKMNWIFGKLGEERKRSVCRQLDQQDDCEEEVGRSKRGR